MPRSLVSGFATAVLAVVSIFAIELPTQAQDAAEVSSGGMDLHLFRPAVDSKGIITVNGADILGHQDFSFGLILDAGLGIVPFEGFVEDDIGRVRGEAASNLEQAAMLSPGDPEIVAALDAVLARQQAVTAGAAETVPASPSATTTTAAAPAMPREPA